MTGDEMAHDTGLAELFRSDLAEPDVTEKRMFGGLCFLWRGHMVCGVHKGGGMIRVGAPNEAAALALPGVRAMDLTGRKMTGFVDLDEAAMADDGLRGRLVAMALAFVATLPPK